MSGGGIGASYGASGGGFVKHMLLITPRRRQWKWDALSVRRWCAGRSPGQPSIFRQALLPHRVVAQHDPHVILYGARNYLFTNLLIASLMRLFHLSCRSHYCRASERVEAARRDDPEDRCQIAWADSLSYHTAYHTRVLRRNFPLLFIRNFRTRGALI